jgi:hypothetical protein
MMKDLKYLKRKIQIKASEQRAERMEMLVSPLLVMICLILLYLVLDVDFQDDNPGDPQQWQSCEKFTQEQIALGEFCNPQENR